MGLAASLSARVIQHAEPGALQCNLLQSDQHLQIGAIALTLAVKKVMHAIHDAIAGRVGVFLL